LVIFTETVFLHNCQLPQASIQCLHRRFKDLTVFFKQQNGRTQVNDFPKKDQLNTRIICVS